MVVGLLGLLGDELILAVDGLEGLVVKVHFERASPALRSLIAHSAHGALGPPHASER